MSAAISNAVCRHGPRIVRLVVAWTFCVATARADVDEQLEAAFQRGYDLQRAQRSAEAIAAYEEALRLAPRAPNHPNLDNLYNNLADMLAVRGDRERAIELYTANLKLRRQRYGPNARQTKRTLSSLATCHMMAVDFDAAAELFEQYLKLQAADYGASSLEAAEALELLANAYAGGQRDDDALRCRVGCLEIRERRLGPNHPEVGRVLVSIAARYIDQARYSDAETTIRRALVIFERHLGRDHHDTGQTANLLGNLYLRTGRFAEAVPWIERGARAWQLEYQRVRSPAYLVFWASTLADLAYLHSRMGQTSLALKSCEQALSLAEQGKRGSELMYAAVLNKVAIVAKDARMLDDAERHYGAALEIYELMLGPEHFNVAEILKNLAAVWSDRGRHDDARAALDRCAKILESKLGATHPSFAHCLSLLASVDTKQERYAEAAAGWERALAIEEAAFSNEGPELARTLSSLAGAYWHLGRFDAALTAFDRARRLYRAHCGRVLPVLADEEQRAFLADDDLPSHLRALALALERSEAGEERAVELSAAWVLNDKATAQQALAERTLLARDTHDPALAGTLLEWLAVRRELANQTFAESPSESTPRFIEQLALREKELGMSLGRAGIRERPAPAWIDVEAVRRAVPADAVLIEFAHMLELDENNEPRQVYVAWIIPPAGVRGVQMVRLAVAEDIERAVATLNETLKPAGLEAVDAGQQFRDAASELARLVLTPLAEEIVDVPRWIISPDSALWVVPWAALPLADGAHAVERHSISLLVSGRELVESTVPRVSGNPPLVIADPDFDFKGDQATADPRQTGWADEADRRRGPAGTLPRDWRRLAGTADEAEMVVPKLREWVKSEPTVLTRSKALEAIFKDVWQPRVAVLSTHGFFFPEAEPSLENSGSPPRRVELPANPLLRCGLVLAGANVATDGHGDDGILTALEVVATDLRGTEMVVLSACETGLGDVHIGQGVAGLRQAFQLAGARSVVASLWQVPDQETAQLMGVFFERLAAGDDKSQALRTAQLALLAAGRAEKGRAAHPYYWAAFTLTGDWRTPEVEPVRQRPARPAMQKTVVVGADSAAVMDGSRVMARVRRGTRLAVLEQRGQWLRVTPPGSDKSGWIALGEVRAEE